MMQNDIDSKLQVKHELWRSGILSWKLDSTQKELYNLFYNSKHKIMTWLLSRRQGKSYSLIVLACEQCIRKPNSIIKYTAPTKIQINNMLRPLFRKILADCPEELQPRFDKKDYIYYFPNGSEIQLAGTDSGHAEKLRGGDSDLWIIDEAGSCSDLHNIIKSILLPTTLITKGRGILASTPPRESDHEFLDYIEDCEKRGSLIIKTIDDNPRITAEQKEELIAEVGGVNTDEAQRELYCKIKKDANTSPLPEFDDELEKQIVKEWPRPPFFDSYVSMDTGGKDFTVLLYGYYDFRADKIIIQDETIIDFQQVGQTTKKLVEEINQKEKTLWTNPISFEYQQPLKRVSDIDYIFLNEIRNQSKLIHYGNQIISFEITPKDNKEAALNTLRIMLSNKRIIIDPKCKTLITHCKYVKWNKQHTKFERSKDNGHYDAVDALLYFVRNVDLRKNPYPATYQSNTRDLFGTVAEKNPMNGMDQLEVYKKIFNYKPRRKY